MTERAAQDPNMPPTDEAEPTETIVEEVEPKVEGQAETAPATVEEDKGGFVETENDKVQARINKITAEKYAEKRRADEAERKLDEQSVQAPQVQTQSTEPKLEDFDYDEAAHTAALIDYKVNQKAEQIQRAQQQQAKAQTQQAQQQSFNEKVAAFTEKATDYEQVVSNLPDLPPQILDAIMQSDKGPELAYHLGKHLDVADALTTLDPVVGAMTLGQISAQLTATTKTVTTSAAPEPIEPINSGGVSSPSMEDMSMEEIYNMK